MFRKLKDLLYEQGINKLKKSIMDKIDELTLRSNIKHVYGSKKIDYTRNEVIVLCLVRNGELYMKSFIEHYFSLGVKQIVFLDNNSMDGTVSIAKKYKNVTILQTNLPYKKYQYLMKQYLIKRFSKNRWSLCVDIDELFDYPFSNILSLDSLIEYLNKNKYTAVVSYMLDMFSNKALGTFKSKQNENLKKNYAYYDIKTIKKKDYDRYTSNTISNKNIKHYYDGICKTIFNADIFLLKHPLIFLSDKISPQIQAHTIANADIADFTSILFHYRFLSDFYEKVLEAVKKENYWKNSIVYKKFYEVLKQNPKLKIKQRTSKKLKSVNQLIDEDFLVISDEYMCWVKKKKSSVVNKKLNL